MKLSGGQLVEQSTHIVDMARYLAGEVHTVFAAGTTGAMTEIENYDIHDCFGYNVTCSIREPWARFTSGCIAEKNGGSKGRHHCERPRLAGVDEFG
jgi:predicted dehydrogenase